MRKCVRWLKKWYDAQKLNRKINILFLGMIGVYILVFLLIYSFYIRKSMFQYALESNYNTMVSIGNNLNGELKNVSAISQLMMRNENVVKYLRGDASSEGKLSNLAMVSLYDISNTFNDISSIYVYKKVGNSFVYISRNLTHMDQTIVHSKKWQSALAQKAGGYMLSINGDGAFESKSGEPVISFSRIINDIETQKPIGILVINLQIKLLESTLKDVTGNEKRFSFYDEQQNLLLKDREIEEVTYLTLTQKAFEQMSINHFLQQKIVAYYHIPETPFILAGIENVSFSDYYSEQAMVLVGVIIILTLLSLMLLGIFITASVTRPIERLVQSMDNVKTGWLRRVSIEVPQDEIGHLKNRYNNMLIEINSLIEELIIKEKNIQRAELEVLQEQIKPHFLYNTLDTIGYLALKGSSEAAYEAIETLGSFYRKFLNKGNNEITLGDEIGIVQDYLKLQKIRYDDIFEDTYDIDASLKNLHVPKLILQPLVENSLYHGIRPKGEKGFIKISVRQVAEEAWVTLYDSGVGMTKEQINQLMQEDHRQHFGFKGTIERIAYFFQSSEVYEIRSEVNQFCEITLKFPLKELHEG